MSRRSLICTLFVVSLRAFCMEDDFVLVKTDKERVDEFLISINFKKRGENLLAKNGRINSLAQAWENASIIQTKNDLLQAYHLAQEIADDAGTMIEQIESFIQDNSDLDPCWLKKFADSKRRLLKGKNTYSIALPDSLLLKIFEFTLPTVTMDYNDIVSDQELATDLITYKSLCLSCKVLNKFMRKKTDIKNILQNHFNRNRQLDSFFNAFIQLKVLFALAKSQDDLCIREKGSVADQIEKYRIKKQ